MNYFCIFLITLFLYLLFTLIFIIIFTKFFANKFISKVIKQAFDTNLIDNDTEDFGDFVESINIIDDKSIPDTIPDTIPRFF